MASEAFFMISRDLDELENSLETLQMMSVQNNNLTHQPLQSTEKLGSCPASPTRCFDRASRDIARHQCSDIDLNLLEDKLKHGHLITQTTNRIILNSKGFDVDAPPSERTSKLPGLVLPSSEFIQHQMSGHTISQTKGFPFVQLNKPTLKTQPRAAASSSTTTTTRVACVPKGCRKGRSKTTESINQASKTSDTKSESVIIPIIPDGAMNTPPSAGDAKEHDVTSQDQPVPRHGSTRRKRRRRKNGTTSKPRTMGQSGDHRQAAFAEAFPPAARTLNIQWLGRSDKGWKDIETMVRCHRLKEERLILRLLRLERLQHLTIEAERKRSSSANVFKARPKPIEVLGPWPFRQSIDQGDRKVRASDVSSRPATAFNCCDATTTLQRKAALVALDVAADRKVAVDGLARCIRELKLNTGDRTLSDGSSRQNGRYAWLSAVESNTLTTTLP